MASIEQHKQVVEEFFAALNEGNVDTLLKLYDEEGTCWTSGNTLISGTMTTAQIVQGAGAVFDVFPQGLRFIIKAMTAEGDRVAVEAESIGEHVSGVTYNNHYHFLFEFRDGRVLRLKEYMDTEMVTDILCGGQRPG